VFSESSRRRRRRQTLSADDPDAGEATTGGGDPGAGNPSLKRRRRCFWDERAALSATASLVNGALAQYVRTLSIDPPPPSPTELPLQPQLPHWQRPLALSVFPPLPPTRLPSPPPSPPHCSHHHHHHHQNPRHMAVAPTPTAQDTATSSSALGWGSAVAPPSHWAVYDSIATIPAGLLRAPGQHRTLPQDWGSRADLMAAAASFPYSGFPYCDLSFQPEVMAASTGAAAAAAAVQQAQPAIGFCGGGCYNVVPVAPDATSSRAVSSAATAATASVGLRTFTYNMNPEEADMGGDQALLPPPAEYSVPLQLPLQRLNASRLHELVHQQQQAEGCVDQRGQQRGAECPARPRAAEGAAGLRGPEENKEEEEGGEIPPCPCDLSPAQLGPIPPTEVLDSELLPSLAERRSHSIQPVGLRPKSSVRSGGGDRK
ncbi:hypothetical protein Vretifemale_14645, partial [Volvox reticuliferus]